MGKKIVHQITGRSPYHLIYPKSLKELSTISYMVTAQNNNLLSSKNSGFKKGDGAVNQMINITEIIYKALDCGNDVAMVFLDISKAFDKVWQKGLLYKLKLFGVV